jgi:hypothetical protein
VVSSDTFDYTIVLGSGTEPPPKEATVFGERYVLWGFIGVCLSVAACTTQDSEDESTGSEVDDGSDQDSLGSSQFTCCINDVGYTCPDQAAFDQCMGFDLHDCMMGCAFGDSDCKNSCFDQASASEPNPEACEEDSSADCSTDSGTCGGTAIPCDLDLDCCEGLVCGPRQDGQPGGSCQ